MNLFVFTVVVPGVAADYKRTVQVLAENEVEAKEKLSAHYGGDTTEFNDPIEVVGKFAIGIFAMPMTETTYR